MLTVGASNSEERPLGWFQGGRVDQKPETAATVRVKGIMGVVSRNRKQTGRSTSTEKRCATLHFLLLLLPSLHMPAKVFCPPETKEAFTQSSQSIGDTKLKTGYLVRCGSIFPSTNPAGQFCKPDF